MNLYRYLEKGPDGSTDGFIFGATEEDFRQGAHNGLDIFRSFFEMGQTKFAKEVMQNDEILQEYGISPETAEVFRRNRDEFEKNGTDRSLAAQYLKNMIQAVEDRLLAGQQLPKVLGLGDDAPSDRDLPDVPSLRSEGEISEYSVSTIYGVREITEMVAKGILGALYINTMITFVADTELLAPVYLQVVDNVLGGIEDEP